MQSNDAGKLLPPSAAEVEFGFSILERGEADLREHVREWLVANVPDEVRRQGFHASVPGFSNYWTNRPNSRLQPIIETVLFEVFAKVGTLSRKFTRYRPSDGAGAGPSSDLASATRLATMMETSLGMGASYRHCAATDDDALESLRRSDPELRGGIDARLAKEFRRAKEILEKERDVLVALAKELFELGTLDPQRVSEIMNARSRKKKRAA
ncbi:hypothetical protein [Agrobacterium vitis]|uniref:Peptidase M41 domain-containing protein n=1 Tax=Agrobacterium vitis TaxID=373 RepID=A0A7K1RC29_AGRVI|nr:hypothetical protein [Agrobacterium vitis]MVA55670.1 hypothetical protein [Agrobacterium vitis]